MTNHSPIPSAVIIPIFFLSGIAGGIYEVVWTKQLLLIFGASAFAVSTVLTAYMAGLAIGSYFIGKYIDRSINNPAKTFAFLELSIAVFGVLIFFLLPFINKIYCVLYPSFLSDYYLKSVVRFFFCFLILMPPTILMGGTFPVLSRGIFSGENSFGRNISRLYAINTLGAMFGAFIVGFILLPQLGVFFSTGSAVCLNLLTAILAYSLYGLYAKDQGKLAPLDTEISKGHEVSKKGLKTFNRLPELLLIVVAATAGFTAMAYEVIYARLLKLVFLASSYHFTIILVSFLAGIGLGSLIVSKFADRIQNRLLVVGFIQLLLGIIAIWAMSAIFNSHVILEYINSLLSGLSWAKSMFCVFAISSSVLIGVAGLSGATLPLIIKFRQERSTSIGGRVGEIYSINTIAAVLGSFAGGFIIIPIMGTYWGLITIVSMNLIAGSVCIYHSEIIRRDWKMVCIGTGVAIAFISVLYNPPILFLGSLIKPGEKVNVLHVDEGASATVNILEKPLKNSTVMYINGFGAIGTDYEGVQTVKLLGHLPMLLSKDPKNVLVVGFGMGATVASIAKHQVTKIDCVEIIPEVLETAHFFSDWNGNVLADPRLNIVIDDGRSFLFGTDEKYDVISSDPIHPAFGSPALYTREYFAECYQKLTDGGVAVQYLPFHQLSLYDLSVLVNTFRSVFPHTSIWLASYHGIIVGQKNVTDFDMDSLTQRMNMPRVKRDLAKHNISGIDDLLSRMILGEAQVDNLVSGIIDVNTDNHTILEYAHSRFFGKNTWIENMNKILGHMGSRPYHELFQSKNIDSTMDARLEKVYLFRQHAIQARLYSEQKMSDQVFQELIKLLELEPADPETLYLSGKAIRLRFLQKAIQLLKKGEGKSAVKTLEKALALGLGSAELFTNLGGLHIAMGDTTKAINMLEKALEIQPEYPPALNILAKIKKNSPL